MTPREAASAAAVAAELRAEVISGRYDRDKGQVPSRADIRERFGISLENASVVLRMLAAEGWVTLEQGRGSFVRPRRRFLVTVEIARPEDDGPRDARLFRRAVDGAAEAEPAVLSVESARLGEPAVRADLVVTAVSPARAAGLAEDVLWSAPGWSWDGLDLAGASVRAEPAELDSPHERPACRVSPG